MPSNQPNNSNLATTPEKLLNEHVLFFPLLLVAVIAWYAYRWLFSFPVWFDETLGKAFFFGLPVWFYTVVSKRKDVLEPLRFSIFQQGLLLGVALGGLYGFITSTMSLLQSGGVVESAQLFQSTQFWYEFALALFTGFWETLFFYCFVAMVVFDKYKKVSLVWQMALIVIIFLVFHLPNAFLRFSPALVMSQVLLLFLFSLGQALVFYRWRNAYALMLSHAIWGLVLLFHGT
ncbi:MAG TPA: hypothetical protein PKH60_00290 [Candidatus Woesebacteria bacterium]|jgi:hypothetical protein|nr:hypothetical protein [Candidatus Woesebacteria bacterium]